MRNTKQILIIALGCLFFGAIIGWSISSSSGDGHEGHGHEAGDGTIFTCSMHPQIRQDEPGQCPLCGMALTPLQARGSGVSDPYVLEMTPEAMALSNVMLTRVGSGVGAQEIRLSGKIQPDEQRVNSLAANYGGRIDRLYVSFTGQEVRRGERLATIYSPDLINAQKELLETARMRDTNPQLYNAARERLRLWNVPEEQIQAIEDRGEVATQFDVFADASGIVTARNVSVGDFISRGTVLFDIVDLSRVWVMLDAYESDLGFINRGDQLTFSVNAYPGRDFTGTVDFIDPVINPDTRTLTVRAEVPNPGGVLKPEMFVTANVKSSAQISETALMIPKTALLWTGKRSVVYVQRGDRTAPAFEMVEVELGPRVGDQYQVLSGLEGGDQVVSNGVFAIDAAAQLTGNYSMMNRPEIKTLDVPEAFRRQFTNLLGDYLALKDQLVETDPADARKKASNMRESLSRVDMSLLDPNAHNTWMELFTPIERSISSMEKSTDVQIQRNAFEVLSNHMIEAVEYFGTEKDRVFKQFCPMAFDNKGAFWLSGEREIRNPYYGDMMLTCGEVRNVYEKGKPTTVNGSGAAAGDSGGHRH
ncbi:efflux RND transporter periplasmic adaptor subunit [Anditalea andensis]|uniref:RND transporter n=1 Tax=Anditalea andensis TaxID=1048983 RepID=A0A074KU69_9BACT|nr:efflux RND transporter periplasmic adaptor subunit [Anditalea andensis]KEO72464.1 RND transporter [Anditalea andensis]